MNKFRRCRALVNIQHIHKGELLYYFTTDINKDVDKDEFLRMHGQTAIDIYGYPEEYVQYSVTKDKDIERPCLFFQGKEDFESCFVDISQERKLKLEKISKKISL